MIDEIQNPEEFRFSQELLKAGLLTEAQMKTSLEYQRSLGGALRDIIVKLGFVDEKRLNAFVAKREHMPTIDLRNREVDAETMKQVPRELIERHSVVPFRQPDGGLLLAMVEPGDFEAVEEIQFLTGSTVETALAPRSQVLEALTRFYEERAEPEAPEVVEPPATPVDAVPPTPAPPAPVIPEIPEIPEVVEASPPPPIPLPETPVAAADPDPDPEVHDELIDRISDPVLGALVRSLVKSGVVDVEAWRAELELQQ